MTVKFKSPGTRHLIGSGIPDSGAKGDRIDWNDVVGRNIVLEEKIDGSEVSFHFDADANLIGRERANEIDLTQRGGAEKHLDDFKDWLVSNADAFFDRIGDRFIVYAEWCALTHCLFYDQLPSCFIEIDVQDKVTGHFLSTELRASLFDGLGVESAPVLFSGMAQDHLHPKVFVVRSQFSSQDPVAGWNEISHGSSSMPKDIDLSGWAEGIYGKIEEDGQVVGRFKWVREDFVRRIVERGKHWKAAPLRRNLQKDCDFRSPFAR